MAITMIDSVTCLMSGTSTDTWEGGRVVYWNAGNTVEYAENSGSLPAGILFTRYLGGEVGAIVGQGGTVLCETDGTVTAGWVGAADDGSGKLVNVSNLNAVGRCYSTDNGNYVRVLVDINKLS